jgi:pimeloyl-ACP methyl ester carboxylesterase
MCTDQVWQELWPKLPDHYELFHLDIKLSGTLDEVVEDLIAQIDCSRNNRSYSLLGFSLGGYLASAVSLRVGESLERLMVVANTPMALPEAEMQQRQRIVAMVMKNGYLGLSASRVLSFIDKKSHEKKTLIALIQHMDKQFDETQLAHFLVPLSKRMNLCQLLIDKARPTWFCWGETDQLVDPQKMQKMAQKNGAVQTHQIAESGHFLPLEQPKKLAQLIFQWQQS